MTLTISVKDNASKRIDKLYKELFKNATQFYNTVGAFGIARMLIRTGAGKDVDENPFRAYSKSYKKWRKKKGHPVNKVNLFLSGQMLGALTYKAFKDRVVIFFKGGISGMQAKKARWNESKGREFFGLSNKDGQMIIKMFETYFRKLTK